MSVLSVTYNKTESPGMASSNNFIQFLCDNVCLSLTLFNCYLLIGLAIYYVEICNLCKSFSL